MVVPNSAHVEVALKETTASRAAASTNRAALPVMGARNAGEQRKRVNGQLGVQDIQHEAMDESEGPGGVLVGEGIAGFEDGVGKIEDVCRAGVAEDGFKDRKDAQERGGEPAAEGHDEEDAGGEAGLIDERIAVAVEGGDRGAGDVARAGGEGGDEDVGEEGEKGMDMARIDYLCC